MKDLLFFIHNEKYEKHEKHEKHINIVGIDFTGDEEESKLSYYNNLLIH
jgi:hypothetical protein